MRYLYSVSTLVAIVAMLLPASVEATRSTCPSADGITYEEGDSWPGRPNVKCVNGEWVASDNCDNCLYTAGGDTAGGDTAGGEAEVIDFFMYRETLEGDSADVAINGNTVRHYGCSESSLGTLEGCSGNLGRTENGKFVPAVEFRYDKKRFRIRELYFKTGGFLVLNMDVTFDGEEVAIGSSLDNAVLYLGGYMAPFSAAKKDNPTDGDVHWPKARKADLRFLGKGNHSVRLAALRPSGPTGVSACGSSGSITLKWSLPYASDWGVKSYQYLMMTHGDWGKWTDVPGSMDSTNKHTVTSLVDTIGYNFRVRAKYEYDVGLQSAMFGPYEETKYDSLGNPTNWLAKVSCSSSGQQRGNLGVAPDPDKKPKPQPPPPPLLCLVSP